MKGTKAAIRYAKSLLDLALEQGKLDVVKKDVSFIAQACETSHELVVMLNSPIIKSDKKVSILKEVLGSDVSELTFKFIELTTLKRRESLIPAITEEYMKLYNIQRGMETVIVTSAVGLDDSLRKKVYEMLKNSVKSEIELVEKTDKSLIGGFTVRIGDKQVDSSVVRALKNLKKTYSDK